MTWKPAVLSDVSLESVLVSKKNPRAIRTYQNQKVHPSFGHLLERMAATIGKESPLATRLSNYGGVLIALVMIAQASEYLRG